MAVERDTESGKSQKSKRIPVTYISDDDSAAMKKDAAIKSSIEYQKQIALRRSNNLLSQDLIDRYQRRLKKRLTPTEARIIKGIVAGKSRRTAARDAGVKGSDAVVSATTSRMLNKVNVKAALQQALASAGVGVESVAQVIVDGLKAEKVTIVGNGEDAMADVSPDHSIRLRAGAMAAKYLGAEDKDDDPQAGGAKTIIFANTATFSSGKYVKDPREVIEGEIA